ncbi:hypothetical protein BGZ46_009599 [Entomortierella lignicola]|nr:hypothetical protein BGZ46_009599 [Entomortierella lignicola]
MTRPEVTEDKQLFYHASSNHLEEIVACYNCILLDYVILWEDIQRKFPTLQQIKINSKIIPFARDMDNALVTPSCIRLHRQDILSVELIEDVEKELISKKGLQQFPAVEEFPFAGSSSIIQYSPPSQYAYHPGIKNMLEVLLRGQYQLSEFCIPRLFIIVPKHPVSLLHTMSTAIWGEQLTLHFLCECGMHSDLKNQSENGAIPRFHLARHEGYDLRRPREFFEKYGSHVLKVLRILQTSAAIGGIILPALSHIGVAGAIDNVANHVENTLQVIQSSIRFTSDYLQQLNAVQEIDTVTSSLPSMQSLEGADLRQLENFLRHNDESRVLGNLYRTITQDGYVEWVCSDHYNPTSSDNCIANKALQDFVETHRGTFEPSKGKVCITLTEDLTKEFYSALKASRGIHDLEIRLNWKVSYHDLCDLEKAINLSNIVALDLDFCNHHRAKKVAAHHRGDAILRMMANHRLQQLVVKNFDSLLSRTMKIHSSMEMQIRTLNLENLFIEEKHYGKLQEVLHLCTSLSKLCLFMHSIDGAHEIVKKVPACYNRLLELDLRQREKASALRISFRGVPTKDQKHSVNTISSISVDTVDLSVSELLKSPNVHQIVLDLANRESQSEESIRSIFIRLYQNFSELKVVGIRCSVSQFFQFYTLAMEMGIRPSLRAMQFGDRLGNELTVYDIDHCKKFLASLPKISITRTHIFAHSEHESTVELFSNFGYRIKELELDDSFIIMQARALSTSLQNGTRSHLEVLSWDISGVTNHEVFAEAFRWLDKQKQYGRTPIVKIKVRLDSQYCTPLERMLSSLKDHVELQNIFYHHMTHFTMSSAGDQSNSIVNMMVSKYQQKMFSKIQDWNIENKSHL